MGSHGFPVLPAQIGCNSAAEYMLRLREMGVIIESMSTLFDELERQARSLAPKEKAALARILIEELDTSLDAEAEQLWIDEAHRRYDAFLKGKLEPRAGDEVMAGVRDRLK